MEQFGDGNYPLQSIGGMSDVVTKGTTPTTLGFEFVSAGVRFVKVENITATGQILKDELMHVTQECHEKLSRSQLCEGDILFSIAGYWPYSNCSSGYTPRKHESGIGNHKT